jgi:hypothetical protein
MPASGGLINKGNIMKRKCRDMQCGKKFVISRLNYKYIKTIAPEKGDENLCDSCFSDANQIAYSCFSDAKQIAYEQSYFYNYN